MSQLCGNTCGFCGTNAAEFRSVIMKRHADNIQFASQNLLKRLDLQISSLRHSCGRNGEGAAKRRTFCDCFAAAALLRKGRRA